MTHLSPKKPVILHPGCLGSTPRAQNSHGVTSGQRNYPRGLGLGETTVYSAVSVMTKSCRLKRYKGKPSGRRSGGNREEAGGVQRSPSLCRRPGPPPPHHHHLADLQASGATPETWTQALSYSFTVLSYPCFWFTYHFSLLR